LKSFDHRKYLEGRKKGIIFRKQAQLSLPQKTLGVRVEINIPKNSKAIIMLALCSGRCLLHHKGIENDQTIFGNVKFAVSQMTKFSDIQFFVQNATISR